MVDSPDSSDSEPQPQTINPSVPKSSLPLRVTYITTTLEFGGAEKNLLTLAKSLPRALFQPRVIGLTAPGRLAQKLDENDIPWTCLHMESPPHPELLFQLIERLEENSTDILHSYLFHSNILGRITGSIAGVPVRLSSIRVCEQEHRSHLFWDRFTLPFVDREICVSESVKQFTMTRGKIPESKLITIPNGIQLSPGDVESFASETLLSELNLPAGSPVLLSAGRLTKQKGFDLLLKSLVPLVDSFPNLRCVVFGKGDLYPQLLEERNRLNLEDHLFFPGWSEKLNEYMTGADLFVLPSRWEGLPNVLLEAAALNVPFLTTDAGGSAEILPVEFRNFPFLVSTGSASALHQALEHRLSDPEAFKQDVLRTGNYVRSTFTVERMVQEHQQLYLDTYLHALS